MDVRMRGFKDRTDVDDAIAQLDRIIGSPGSETVPLLSAADRVLAAAVVAPASVPTFDRSAMDGYAVRAEETFGASPFNESTFHIVGEAFPGRPAPRSVGPGEAVRIMTGAPLPSGADGVVMAENTRLDGAVVHVNEAIPPGKNVGRMGEDVLVGQTLLAPGRRLRPQDLAVLGAVGVTQVTVVSRPTVSLLITGNELLPVGSLVKPFHIIDSNSVMLRALVARDGGVVLNQGENEPTPILQDAREVIQEGLLTAPGSIVLVSGGSSVGAEDHAPSLLAELGELRVHGLALRPAAPAGFGVLGDRLVFLLPGNPVSCLCAYDLFAGRAIRRRAGRPTDLPYRRAAGRLSRKVTSAVGRVDYVRARWSAPGEIEPLAISGASILSSTVRADGFLLVPRDLEGYPEGADVDFWLYDGAPNF